jgi:hypothetical protein
MPGAPTTPLTYNGLVTQVCLLAPYQFDTSGPVVLPLNQPEFTALIPMMLTYAEQRIQRDLELLNTQVMRGPYALVVGSNQLSVPPADLMVIQDVLVSIGGAPTPMNPVSKAYMLTVWPSTSAPGPPKVVALQGGDAATLGQTGTILLFGPPPDLPYQVNCIGESRPPSLATFGDPGEAGTATTWISTWLPDLLVMACMIYVSGYQRDFGRQSDDPQMAQSYEAQYGTLLDGVNKQEFQRRWEADAWTAQAKSPVATPTR